jgi:chromosomal replication initiator protein DnaA
VSFAPGVLEALAEAEVANVRELIGLLNRLIALQAVSESPIGIQDVRALLGDWLPPGGQVGAVRDEFAQFVSHISAAVSQTVEVWRRRLGEAILRWKAEGYNTARLEALLAEQASLGAEQEIERFEGEVAMLKELEREAAVLDRSAAENPVFRDPDRLEEAKALLEKVREGLIPLPQPAPLWTFAGYMPGACNKVALGAARAVCEAPGERYNPLVLVGRAGVGKTHLMHAIGNTLLTLPGSVIACLSAEEFVEQLVEATEQNRVEAWRVRFRRVTALLMDDVHLLAGKDRSQEELFHLFNLLIGSQAQLVFTSNRPPTEVPGLDDRLVSRLEGGLVATLGAPDRELKAALARRHLKASGQGPDEDLVDYLASRTADSVRAILGMIQRVNGAAEARGVEPTVALAKEVLGGEPSKMRPTRPVPASGIVVSPVSAVRSREKFVWYWPDVAGRVIGGWS